MKKGDRVEMTELAISMGLQGRKDRRVGTVRGVPERDLIRVERDGIKTIDTWYAKFWRLVEPAP
jgi:hypothetical protein